VRGRVWQRSPGRGKPWTFVVDLPVGPDGRRRQVSKGGHSTKAAAEAAMTSVMTDARRGAWAEPRAGATTLCEYATSWLEDHPGLRPRTRELYESLLRRHILSALGQHKLSAITPALIRSWHSGLVRADKPGPVTVAKCYRLLRTILGTAVADEVIVKNPCNLKGAGVERSAECPVATVAQVYALADAVEPRFKLLVLMAAFTGLRFGELAGLRRRALDPFQGTVTVSEVLTELAGGRLIVGPPKSEAGRRTVAIPPHLLPEVEAHLAACGSVDPEALVFTGERGAPLTRARWSIKWREACRTAGVERMHFHDLRHSGNTMAAATGASTKELMARMGHSSVRAALLYQHATADRDRAIAAALSDMVSRASS